MDPDTEKLHLSNIEECIIDEEKVISYLWLSKTLSIHVNDCKKLLQKFVINYRSKHPDRPVSVSLVVSGVRTDGKAVTTIVAEDSVDKLCSEFEKILFKHIYSIQKSPARIDHNALVNLNPLNDFSSVIGKISNDKCSKRPENDLSNLRTRSYTALEKAESQQKLVAKGLKKEPSKAKTPVKSSPRKSPYKTEKSPSKSEKLVQKSNGIASMFSAQSAKQSKEPTKQQEKSKHPKNIANFFNAPTTSTKSEKTFTEKEPKPEKKIDSEIKIKKEIPKQPEITPKVDVKTENFTQREKSQSKPDKKKTNKKQKVEKTRKRVLQLSDSEDEPQPEDPFSDQEMEVKVEDDEDVIPPTPEPVAKVSVTSAAINPRKRRKIVDKTYTDEEGYILTKKVEVYESCSEDESDKKENIKEENKKKENKKEERRVQEVVKSPPKRGKKKISPPAKGKQATLMNFFSRKG